MRIGEIIRQYRTDHGLSLRAFAGLSDISASYVRKLEMDVENKSSITIPKIASIAKAMGLTPDELLSAMDDTKVDLRPEKSSRSNLPPDAFSVPDLSGLKRIPILGPSACGVPIEAVRAYEFIEVDSALHADFALYAEGKSMTGCGIMDGSMVFFQETPSVSNGEIAAITVDNATTIKRFYQYGDTIVLKPCNPDFDDQEYQGNELEEIHIFGKAIACLTGF